MIWNGDKALGGIGTVCLFLLSLFHDRKGELEKKNKMSRFGGGRNFQRAFGFWGWSAVFVF